MHMHTPFLPALRPVLAPMGGRIARTVRQTHAYTLCQLESALGGWVPPHLFPKAPVKENSRDQHYTRWRSFWCMLWQAFNPDASGREVVRQLQALFKLQEGPQISEEDGAYCRAKARLPLTEFPKVLSATAQAADRLAPSMTRLRGRALKAVDGSTVTVSDTPKNRKAYPPLQCADRPSFPMLRIVVFFSVLSGAISAVATGSLAASELALVSTLSHQLSGGDILLGDRGFGCYPFIAWLKFSLGVDFIGRTTRRVDGRRRRRRLGHNDWLILWKRKGTPSAWLSPLQWAGLPNELSLRAVRGRCFVKGFRVRQITLVTTLLDPQRYPAQEILQAYWRRWRLEMCLDDLKTTLKMEFLRARSPQMLQKELLLRLTAQNLIRCTAAQAATEHGVALERISFKGSVDGLRHFASAMAQARSQQKRQQLWAELLHTLAADLVPERPNRREPRAVKRKKNKYPRLNGPRRQFRDRPKRNLRRTRARLRRLGLM